MKEGGTKPNEECTMHVRISAFSIVVVVTVIAAVVSVIWMQLTKCFDNARCSTQAKERCNNQELQICLHLVDCEK